MNTSLNPGRSSTMRNRSSAAFQSFRIRARAARSASFRSRSQTSNEGGQASVEYALVLLGAAIVATVLISWATNNNILSGLFDFVVETIKSKVK